MADQLSHYSLWRSTPWEFLIKHSVGNMNSPQRTIAFLAYQLNSGSMPVPTAFQRALGTKSGLAKNYPTASYPKRRSPVSQVGLETDAFSRGAGSSYQGESVRSGTRTLRKEFFVITVDSARPPPNAGDLSHTHLVRYLLPGRGPGVVIPAYAGIQFPQSRLQRDSWAPTFVGVTVLIPALIVKSPALPPPAAIHVSLSLRGAERRANEIASLRSQCQKIGALIGSSAFGGYNKDRLVSSDRVVYNVS